jgi:hypothetical protein
LFPAIFAPNLHVLFISFLPASLGLPEDLRRGQQQEIANLLLVWVTYVFFPNVSDLSKSNRCVQVTLFFISRQNKGRPPFPKLVSGTPHLCGSRLRFTTSRQAALKSPQIADDQRLACATRGM